MRLARARLSEVQLALMMLTRLPAGQIAVLPAMGAAAWAFPLVGGLVGAVGGGFAGRIGAGPGPDDGRRACAAGGGFGDGGAA